MVSVARELSVTEQWRQNNFFFGDEIAGTKVQSPKTVLSLSLGKHVGFEDNKFFCCIPYISDDEFCYCFRAIQFEKKCTQQYICMHKIIPMIILMLLVESDGRPL
jgi:hypothetical protein